MEEINLKDFFSYLKHYIVAFILMIVLAVGGVTIYDTVFKKPIYQAQTTVVIAKSENSTNAAATLNDVNVSQKLTSTYGEIAKSELVLNQVISNLDLGIGVKSLSSNVTVKPVEDTSILSVTVRDRDAVKAAEIANEALSIAADICIFTNHNIVLEEIE